MGRLANDDGLHHQITFRITFITKQDRTKYFMEIVTIDGYQTHNGVIIDQIRKLINNSNKDIEILWIPGHCGIPGNEKVDKCAKEILQDQPQNDIPCPASDYLNHLHSSFRATLQLVWDLGESNDTGSLIYHANYTF